MPVAGDPAKPAEHSCGYTRLVPLDARSFLIAYSDFNTPDENSQPCKAILVRRVEVERLPSAGE